jgi:hypothetical protein
MDLAFFKRFITVPVAKGPLAALPRTSRVTAATVATTESALTPAPELEPPAQPPVEQLSLVAAGATSRKGLALEVQSTSSGYLYCYSQDPVSQKIVRIFPNRFVRDPRIDAGKPVLLPGGQRFVLNPAAQYACLHAPREVYGDLPAPLRWGDFEEIRLKSFDEIRAHFSQVSGAHIELQRLKGLQHGFE